MNEPPSPPPSSAQKPRLITGGILFIILWIGAHLLWAAMSLMANLMANDSGQASADQQMVLIIGMLAGQILAGASGIPAGLAFFWQGKRKVLLWSFAIAFVLGTLCQAVVFYTFFASAAFSHS